jgi:hypothetical protein
MRYTWKITPDELQEYTKNRKNLVERWRKWKMHCTLVADYAEMLKGFTNNEEKMYEEELKDLELAYKKTLVAVSTKMDYMLPEFVNSMKMFIELYETKETIEEKLSILKEKMGDEDGSEA